MTDVDDLAIWAGCGAMALTGRADGPPSAEPAGLVTAAVAAAADVEAMTARLDRPVVVDGPALLAERSAHARLARQGSVSVGGAARFERCRDGWVVLNLPRPEDIAALPALVEAAIEPTDWRAIRPALGRWTAGDLVDRARLLGLAVARPDERPQLAAPGRELRRGVERPVAERPLVLDFSSLWAGPLAASLLADAGARVVKVEGRGRPDGARSGPSAFHDVLNAGKESISIDFTDRADQALLRRLVAAADLVIEASRPRAMTAVGLDPMVVVEESATSWLSITGHGRVDDPDRIGFGDDAAVAGGLWVDDPDGPMFVADAIADPLAGMAAAALAAELLAGERTAAIEVPLSRAAAWARSRPVEASVTRAGGTADDRWTVTASGRRFAVADPFVTRSRGRAVPLDAHGSSLRAEFSER
ncbi:MAG: CoA transferase [Actinomycetota bacterium]